jgi:hypothetical protein
MVFSKVKWDLTTTSINSDNLTKLDTAIDYACKKTVEEVKMKPKTCINCCAPLHSNVCEYCGSRYDEKDPNFQIREVPKILRDSYNFYELEIEGKKRLFYVANKEFRGANIDSYVDSNGNLHRTVCEGKMKLTLIEK